MHNRTLASADERAAFADSLMMRDAVSNIAEILKPRLQSAKRWGVYRAALTQMENSLVEALKTVESEHLHLIHNSLKGKAIKITSRPVAEIDNDNRPVEVRTKDLMLLASVALEQQCSFCLIADDIEKMRTCPLRKTLDALPINLNNDSLYQPCTFALAKAELNRKAKDKPQTKRAKYRKRR